MTVSEWADKYRVLSAEDSAEVGPWRTSRAEFQRGIMDAMSDPAIEEGVLKTSSQVGKTALLLNLLGYLIHRDPGPALVVTPTATNAEMWSKDRLMPMVRDSHALNDIMGEATTRSSSQTIVRKTFPGGQLSLVGSESPAELAARPIRYLLLDEVSRMARSAGAEGDPVLLAKKRTTTYWNRKIWMASTPTVKGVCRITKAFDESDQRHYHVPCVHCGTLDELVWAQVRWDDVASGEHDAAAATARYECPHCQKAMDDQQINAAVRKGTWVAKYPERKIAGFHISELYSPWVPLAKTVKAYLSAQAMGEEALQVFMNTHLGLEYEVTGESPEWERIYDRRENYQIGIVPDGALFLTAGVDKQHDRLEVEIVAWGRRHESWSVDYRTYNGNTRDLDDPVWAKLRELLSERFGTASGGSMILKTLAIDSGDDPQPVYAWSRTAGAQVMVVKGTDANRYPVQGPSLVDIDYAGRKQKRGARLWTVSSKLFKAELYSQLRIEPRRDGTEGYPFGYCHFPMYDSEYFEQLCAERIVVKTDRHGFPVHVWEKTRARNEALDCRVYARAAAEATLATLNDRRAAALERKAHSEQAPDKRQVAQPAPRTSDYLADQQASKQGQQPKRKNTNSTRYGGSNYLRG